ncbi:hypothetical protein RMCBS344292_12271 [Rhizopus microsporus]|nr:hypothetical protein RMCBS344292_12271 [Rhizopus microsporus]
MALDNGHLSIDYAHPVGYKKDTLVQTVLVSVRQERLRHSLLNSCLMSHRQEVPVDREAIESLGIQCVVADPDPNSEEPRYHPGLLQKVLSEILFKDKQP